MPIIIRHNGALNNIAAGAASGMRAGYDIQAQQKAQKLNEDKLNLLKEENTRLIEEKAAATESAKQLAEWKAKYGGMDPGQPTKPETIGPRTKEQDLWESTQNEKMGSFRRMIAGAKDPESARRMSEEFQNEHEQEQLERSRQMAISHWQKLAQEPGVQGVDLPGEDGKGEAANRAASFMEALTSAGPEQLPELLQMSSKAYGDTNELLKKRHKRQLEAQSVINRWAPKLDETAAMIDALRERGQDDAADILEEQYNYQADALSAYSVNPGDVDAMDFTRIMHSGSGRSYSRGRSSSRSSSGKADEDPNSRTDLRDFSVSDFKRKVVTKNASTGDEVTTEEFMPNDEIERVLGVLQGFRSGVGKGGNLPFSMGPGGSAGAQGTPPPAGSQPGTTPPPQQNGFATPLPRTSGGGKVFDLTGQTGRTLPEQEAQFQTEDIEGAFNEMPPEAQKAFVRRYKASRKDGEKFMREWLNATPEQRKEMISSDAPPSLPAENG